MSNIDAEQWEKGYDMTTEEFEQWEKDMEHGIEHDDPRNWDEDGNWIG